MEEKNIYKNKNKKIKIEILKSKIKTCHVEELENNIELIIAISILISTLIKSCSEGKSSCTVGDCDWCSRDIKSTVTGLLEKINLLELIQVI